MGQRHLSQNTDHFALAVIEISHIHPEGSVTSQIDQARVDLLCINRLPVRGQTHHFVFTGVHTETEIIGEGTVQETQRVRGAQAATRVRQRMRKVDWRPGPPGWPWPPRGQAA